MKDNEQDHKTYQYQRAYIRYLRYLVQWITVIIVIYSGFSLYTFFKYLNKGNIPEFNKPLSVEGFMPIGALMALKLWITEKIFDPVHPAALVIFIAALLLAIFLKKGFCGWICPVGTVSELVWKSGKKILRKNFSLPKYFDYPLRSLKYLLMAFFVYVILVKMSPESIKVFLFTPYWKVADLKLLVFFTDMSMTTLIVLLSLTVLSFVSRNFWCRYLCPYGALLGLLSFFSPLKITRNESKCIHCHRCTKSCPSLLPVETKERVLSPECIGCLTCVSNCPSKGALDVALTHRRMLNPLVYVALLNVIFWGSIYTAKATERWQSAVTYEEYMKILPHISKLEHP